MSLKKNVRDHSARKNQGSADFFRKQRKERNAAREPQFVLHTTFEVGESKIEKVIRKRD